MEKGFLEMLLICAIRKSHLQTCLQNTVHFWGEQVNEMIRGGIKRDRCLELHNELMQSREDVTLKHLD